MSVQYGSRVWSTSLIQWTELPTRTVGQHLRPNDISVTFHYGVGRPELVRLLRVEAGVNAAEDHVGALFSGSASDLVSAERVAGVDSDTTMSPS